MGPSSSRSHAPRNSPLGGAGSSAALADTIIRDYHGGTVTSLLLPSIHVFRNPPVRGAEFHRVAPHRRGTRGGEYGSDEELGSRLPQGDEGAPRRGSNRPIGGIGDRPPADAGRPQAGGGFHPHREAPLRRAPVCEGVLRREAGGVARPLPGRTLQRIHEGREGA